VYFGYSQGSSDSIVSEHILDDQALILGRDKGFFFYPLYPDWFWSPPSLLSSGYHGFLPWGKAQPGVLTLTTYPHLVPRSRINRSHTPSSPWYVPGQIYFTVVCLSRLHVESNKILISSTLLGYAYTDNRRRNNYNLPGFSSA
jgi:hypothetical protein